MMFGENNFRATCSCGRCVGNKQLDDLYGNRPGEIKQEDNKKEDYIMKMKKTLLSELDCNVEVVIGDFVSPEDLKDCGVLDRGNIGELKESEESVLKGKICKFIALTIVESKEYDRDTLVNFIVAMFDGKYSIDEHFSIMNNVELYLEDNDIEYLEKTIRNNYDNIRDNIKKEVMVEYNKRFL